MSTNAASWFYNPPGDRAYMISERINGTFWAARIIGTYWQCTSDAPPYRAIGYRESGPSLDMEWEPGKWLALRFALGDDPVEVVDAVSKRILGRGPAVAFTDADGNQVYEWHTDGGHARWQEIQGKPIYGSPRRLSKK